MPSILSDLLARNPNYVYPLAINLVAGVIPLWAGLTVGEARKRVGLKYPAVFCEGTADEAKDKEKYLFNCAQRAHQVKRC